MSTRPSISVSVITFNEEDNLRACLDSVTWADDIVVVDSFSTDATLDIAREFTDRIHQRAWNGINEQRQFALEQCRGDWVLCLDADERVTPELRDEILAVFDRGNPDCNGFLIPRRAYYLGQWIRHCGWYPDRKLRLFRRASARFGDNDPHDKVVLDGAVKTLGGDLLHYTYRDLTHNLRTINTFSSVAAERCARQGRDTGVLDLIVRPPWRFIKQYILRLGFLDGLPGLIICAMSAFSAFAREAKIWELTEAAAPATSSEEGPDHEHRADG